MHTFSPAKLWIAGLDALDVPLLHLHTQSNVALPWADINMDFMNLNQAAHGDREFGYVQTRLGLARKTVAGHVSDPRVTARIGGWARTPRPDLLTAAEAWLTAGGPHHAALTQALGMAELHDLAEMTGIELA